MSLGPCLCVGMTNRAVMLNEVGDKIAMRVDSWRWGMLSWSDLWNVIELLVVTLSMGFALGYMCAVKFERARMKPIPVGTKIVKQSTSTVGTQSKGASRRTIGTQSQCTYKRKLLTPRFHVLPEQADGVFDVSFSD